MNLLGRGISNLPDHISSGRFEDHPVLEDEDGNRYLCMAVLEATNVSGWKWFVFGAVGDVERKDHASYGDDLLLYGYVTGSRNCLGTFSLASLRQLDSYVYTEPAIIRSKCPPEGWRIVDDEEEVQDRLPGPALELPGQG